MSRSSGPTLLAIVSLLWSTPACDCAGDEPSFTGARPPVTEPAPRGDETIPGAVDEHALAPATRTDLPASSPAVTVLVEGRRVIVTNEALIATWPPGDRERLASAPPPGATEHWPSLRTELELTEDTPLRVPGLVEALTATLDVERTRSGSGAPTAVALRVTGASPWSSVERVLFAAGMAGLSDPRFVLASGRDEVELRLPLPRVEGPALTGPLAGRDPAEVVAAIQGALAAHGHAASPSLPTAPRAEAEPELVGGAEALAAETPPQPSGTASRMIVRLETSGLVVSRGADRLGAGCQRAALSPAPSLPSAGITRTSVRDCLLSAGATSHPYLFESAPDITFARVAPVLEVLDEIGTVSISTTSR